MIDTELSQEVAFFVRTCCYVDFGADPFGQLDGSNTHAARGTVDKDLFPGLQSRQMVQGVIDREEGAGDGRCGFEGNSGRDVRDGTSLGNYPIAKTGRPEADNQISRRESGRLAADAAYDAGKLQTQCRAGKAVFDGFVGKHAKGVHDVAEIQTGSVDLDFDFIAGGHAARMGFPAQVAQLARELEGEAYGWIFNLQMLLRPWLKSQAWRIACALPGQDDFLFLVRLLEFLIQRCDYGFGRQRIFQIDQAHGAVGGFVNQGSTESP